MLKRYAKNKTSPLPSMVFIPPSITSRRSVGLRQISPVPGGQKPQKGTNGRCSTIVEESNGLTNWLRFLQKSFINSQLTLHCFTSLTRTASCTVAIIIRSKNNSKESSKLVSPSLLGFLSPGNGGTEEGVKTIEDGRGFLLPIP